jgi:hypothetical protein
MALSGDIGVNQSYEPGATPHISRINLQQVKSDLKTVQLNGPDTSQTLTIPESGDFALPALQKVGVYTTDPVIPGFERIAVNLLDSSESNLVPATAPPGNIGDAIIATGHKSRLDLWWWIIACAALPILMIEWWVYTRRVHL